MAKKDKNSDSNTLAKNRKAYFNYEVVEKFEAGIALIGSEVKSIKDGHVSIKESYGKFVGYELYLINMHISEYKNSGVFNHDIMRERKLLLSKKELKRLAQKSDTDGYTIVPLSVYKKKHLIKIQIGLCRGKREYEKRDTIKERDAKREISRAMKHSLR